MEKVKARQLGLETSEDEFHSFEEESEQNIKMKSSHAEEDDEAPEEYSNSKFKTRSSPGQDFTTEDEFHTDDGAGDSGSEVDGNDLAIDGAQEDEDDGEDDATEMIADQGDRRVEAEEEEGGDQQEDIEDAKTPTAPLLPPELLNSAPRASLPSTHTKFDFSEDDDMSADEQPLTKRKASKALSGPGKKRMMTKLRRASAGTGVLEGGYAAQAKRGLTDRVRDGRIRKGERKRPKVSGRQQMVNQRQRDIQDLREFRRPSGGKLRRGRR